MLIIGNWKSYIERKEDAKDHMAATKRAAAKSRHKIVVAPPFPFVGMLATDKRAKVQVAGQDVSDSTGGAATGEVSATTLKQAGAAYAIIGHSERRARGETDVLIAEKVVRAVSAGLIPVVCVGEKERDANAQYLAQLRTQIESALAKLQPKERTKVVIAYEPIWAIGKSAAEAAVPRDVAEMMLYIKKVVAPLGVAKPVILYGGSVEPANALALAKEGGVGGFLVGHASADAKAFSAIVKAVS